MANLFAQLKKYDRPIADLVSQVELARHFLADELGLEGAGLPHQTAALLATPLARDLQALAIFAETGEGNHEAVLWTITLILNRLFAPPYNPRGLEHIPAAFWRQPVGGLIAKAQARVFGDDLITIAEAARLAGVRSTTIRSALDRGDLTAYNDPTARHRQGHRCVRRSQVMARWGEPPAHPEPADAWEVYERRVSGVNQMVVVHAGVIVNQWVTHFGEARLLNGHVVTVLGTEQHDQRQGNPEWVGHPAMLLTGRALRQVHTQEELAFHLHRHFSLGGGKARPHLVEAQDSPER
jgi:hypothetical protein